MEWLRMSRIRKLSLAGLILLLVVGIFCWSSMRSISSLDSPDIRRAGVVYGIEPRTVAESEDSCPIPLPNTASNVQYAVWSFGQVTQAWIRFEAPVADCLAHAEEMVQPFRNRENYTVTTTRIPEDTGVLCVLDPSEVDLSWFEPSQSATGPIFRVEGGRAPVIWVDTEWGTFYCEVKNECHSLSPL